MVPMWHLGDSESGDRWPGMYVIYRSNPGAVPPPYYYEVVIRADEDGDGVLECRPGRAGDPAPTWRWTFSGRQGVLRQLARALEPGLLRDAPKEPSVSVGGRVESLTVVHGESARAVAADHALCSLARATVPEHVWEEVATRLKSWQARPAEE